MSVEMVLVILRLVACGMSIAGAVYLASIGKDGWGWLLFVALVLGGISYSSTKD